MTRPLRGASVSVIDTETTGLGEDARIVSLAVVHIAQLGISEPTVAFYSRINPEMPIPVEASNIHGIFDADVQDCPTFGAVLEELDAAIGDFIPAAFNAPFDRRILNSEFQRVGCSLRIGSGILDPYVWSKLTDKYEKGKKLVDVARRRGITFDAHSAEADALTTAKLMPPLLREMGRGRQGNRGWMGPWSKPADMADVDAFLLWQRGHALAQEQDYASYCAKNNKEKPTMLWHDIFGVDPWQPDDGEGTGGHDSDSWDVNPKGWGTS